MNKNLNIVERYDLNKDLSNKLKDKKFNPANLVSELYFILKNYYPELKKEFIDFVDYIDKLNKTKKNKGLDYISSTYRFYIVENEFIRIDFTLSNNKQVEIIGIFDELEQKPVE